LNTTLDQNPQPLVVPQTAGVPMETRKSLGKTKNIGENLEKWCAKQVKKIEKSDETGYRRRWKRWLTNWLFYEGRQFGEFSRLDGEFIDAVPTAQYKFHVDNQFSWLIDSSQKEWARAKTKLIARPMYDSPENAGKARVATDVLAHEQKRLWTPFEHQAEGLTAAMCGVYARYTTFDPNAPGAKAKIPQFEKRQLQTEGYQHCIDCELAAAQEEEQALLAQGQVDPMQAQPMQQAQQGYQFGALGAEPIEPSEEGFPSGLQAPQPEVLEEPAPATPDMLMGDMGGMPTCPVCGSTNVEVGEPVNMEFDAVTGYEEVNAGRIVSFQVDPFQLRVASHARKGRVQSSPYVHWERKLPFSQIEVAFPWADRQKMRHGSKDGANQRFISELERSGGNVSDSDYSRGTSEDEDEDTFTVTQTWYDLSEYAYCTLSEPMQLDSGEEIPANVPLGQIYPNGMCFVMAGKQLLAVWDENKNKRWVFGVYRILPTTFWGRGVEDAVKDQQLLNDIYNLLIMWLQYCCSPIAIGNAASGLDNEDFSGMPGEIAWLEGWDTSQPVSNAFQQLNPPQMPVAIMQFLQDRKAAIQAKIGSFSTSSGAPDIDISTATGIKLLREASVALIAMALLLKSQVDAEWGEQILELAQENWIFPQPVQTSTEYGAIETKWFTNADLQTELQVAYEEGSVTPRSEIEKRKDLLEALNPANIPLGPWNEQIPPEVRRLLAETFGIPFNSDLYQQQEKVAKVRCDELLQAIQEFASAAEQAGIPAEPDPMTGQIPAVQFVLEQVPIEPLMDDHDVQMRYIRKWFSSDDGMHAEEIVKEAMRMRYQEHMNAKVMQAQTESMAAIAANAPQMEMQAAQAAMGAQNQPPNGKKPGKSPSQTPQNPKGNQIENPYG